MNKYGMQPYTYLIGWREKDVWYYGSRIANKVPPEDDLWKEYQTSSVYLKSFLKENGEPDVIRVHRIFDDTYDAQNYEEKFQRRCGVLKTNRWLNENIFGKPPGGTPKQIASVKGKKQSEEVKIKRGIYNPKSEETKKKMSSANTGSNNSQFGRVGSEHPQYGRKRTPEQIANIRLGQIRLAEKRRINGEVITRGPMSEETKEKLRQSKLGKKRSSESVQKGIETRRANGTLAKSDITKQRMSDASKGKSKSAEHKSKISNAMRGIKQKPRSAEHSRKISEAHARRKLG